MSNVVKEYESRIMLTESEYFEIVSHFMRLYPNKHFLKNVNIYFDTEDLYLRKNHITFRIRIINDIRPELTIKIKGLNGDTEINDNLNLKEVDMILNEHVFPEGNVRNFLLTLPYSFDAYNEITTLYNIRLEIEEKDHLVVIDKNKYGDIVDYNLEIETKDNIKTAKMWLEHYIAQVGKQAPMGTQMYIMMTNIAPREHSTVSGIFTLRSSMSIRARLA